VPTSDEFCGQTSFWIRSRHCAAAFSLPVPNSCTNPDQTLLNILWHISSLRTHTKFVRENIMLALGVCCPQRGYWDSARLLGESCWQNNWGAIRGNSGKTLAQKSRNSCWVNGGGVGAHRQWAIGAPDPNTNAQRMSLLSHVLPHLGPPWYRSVTASRAVSNRESRYPPRNPARLLSLFVCLFVCWKDTRKTILHLLCWEGSEPPGSGHTRTEAQATCLPKTAAHTKYRSIYG